MKNIMNEAEGIFYELEENYHYLHKNAEVGFQLEKTVAFVKNKLCEIGCKFKEIGKSGIIAEVGEKGRGDTILLRADMDALPIKEESGVDFSCKNGNCQYLYGYKDGYSKNSNFLCTNENKYLNK